MKESPKLIWHPGGHADGKGLRASGLDTIVEKWLSAAHVRGQLDHDSKTRPMITDLKIELKNDLKTCFKSLTLNTMQEGINLKRPIDDWYWLSIAKGIDDL